MRWMASSQLRVAIVALLFIVSLGANPWLRPILFGQTASVSAAATASEPSQYESKILVIVMGSIRGGEKTWQSLYRNVLDVNHADLALAVGQSPSKKKTSSLYKRAKYVWEFPEYEDWTDALNLINNNQTSKTNKLLDAANPGGMLGGCRRGNHTFGSGAIIFWIRWFIAQHIKEYSLTKKYTRFVITRSDHYYMCEHNLTDLAASDVWIPQEGQDFSGYTDRHVVAPADKILDVLNILPPLLEDPDRYIREKYTQHNAEGLIKARWTEDGITPKRFERVMFTCGVRGDATRTSPLSGFVVEEGVHLKSSYWGEYQQSHHTCFDKSFMKRIEEHILDPAYPNIWQILRKKLRGHYEKKDVPNPWIPDKPRWMQRNVVP